MMTLRHIKRFFALSGADRVALLSYGVRVPVYQLALIVMGYERFQRIFIPSQLSGRTPKSIEYAKHHGQLVNMAVGAIAGGDNCLLRSVILSRHLAKRGYAPEVIFGTRKDCSSFQAHSWVEVDGLVVNDRDDIALSHALFEAPNK